MRNPYGLSAALLSTAVTVIFSNSDTAFATLSATQIDAIAHQVTVKIDGQNPGSGVIVARQEQTYYVLTAEHVVATPDEYDLVTPDGQSYRVDYQRIKKLPGVDLAIVLFTSAKNYQVVAMGRSSQVREGTVAYVAGFPMLNPETVQTRYQFSDGEIAAQASRPLANGYALAYFNYTFAGMSGGQQGQLVGIHGSTRLTGLLADTRTETRGFDANSGEKIGLNLAIPIDTFLRLSSQVEPSLEFAALPATPPAPSQPTANDLFIQAIDQEAAGDLSGKPTSALTLLNEAIHLQPNFALAYFQRGNVNAEIAGLADITGKSELRAKYIPRAIANFTEAIRINPNFSAAYHNRGRLRTATGDLQGAIADYTQAIQINPKSPSPYNSRGLVRSFSLQDLQGGLTDFDKAIRLKPMSAIYYYNRASVRSSLEDIQGAIADLDRSISLSPNATAYYLRGKVRAQSNDFAKAITDYDEAIRLQPTFYQAYNNRGLVRRETQDYRGAIVDFTEVIHLKSTSAGAYLNRGLAYEKTGAQNEAATDFQKAAELAAVQGDNRLQQMALNSLKRVR
jgi:tetratricopeptide (TPR) repeat protein